MAKSHLTLLLPAIENCTVERPKPRRQPNAELRTREHLHEVDRLIETALCRARHKAVYADCRTMPNGLVFPGIHRERRVIGSA